MKKLIITFLLIFVLSLTAFAGSAVFSLSSAEADAGDSVKLTLSLKCTEEANSFAVSKLNFDTSVLEFTGFTENSAISDLTILPPTFDSDKGVIVIGLTDSQKFEGELCTVEFVVKDDAFSGSYEISASTVAKNNSTPVESSFASGTVKINGKEPPEPTVPTTPTTPTVPTVPTVPTTPTTPTTPTVPDKPVEWKNPFNDVEESDWYYGSVKYANENGIINGVSPTEFAPKLNVTRAMFVTLLYRLEKQPDTVECKFTDVQKGSWYEKAVAWANEKGIVFGVSDTEFAPDSNITREQMATMLCRWAKFKGKNVASSVKLNYSDKDNISDWAKDNIAWTTENGIMTGSGSSFLPKNFATRAEAAAVIERIAKKAD